MHLNQRYFLKPLIYLYKTVSSQSLHTPSILYTFMIKPDPSSTFSLILINSWSDHILDSSSEIWYGTSPNITKSYSPISTLHINFPPSSFLISSKPLIRSEFPYMAVCTLTKATPWKLSFTSTRLSLHNLCTHPSSFALQWSKQILLSLFLSFWSTHNLLIFWIPPLKFGMVHLPIWINHIPQHDLCTLSSHPQHSLSHQNHW